MALLRDAYCVSTSGVPFAFSLQCAQLLSTQLVEVAFLLLCMRRVLGLVGTRKPVAKPARIGGCARALANALVLLAASATLVSVAQSVLAFPLRSTAALVLSGAISSATWWFYSAALCLESPRRLTSPPSVVWTLALLATLELAQAPQWHSPLSDPKGHLVVALQHARIALTVAIGLLVMSVAASAVDDTTRGAASAFDRASFLSRVSYTWISPLIAIGKARRLEIGDVPELPQEDATPAAARRFQSALAHERRGPGAEVSFVRMLRRLYGREIAVFALWSTANKLIGLASPLLIKLFLDWAESHPSPDLSTGYTLAGAMVLRSLAASVSGTQYSLAWKRFDLRVRAGLISAIYSRTISLSTPAKQRVGGIGHVSNLVSVDVGRLVGMPGTFFDMFLIPIEIVFSLMLLAHEVKYAFVGGVVVLACMLPIQTLLGGKIQSVTKKMLEFRDKRVEKTAESLKAMRTIKLLAWVEVYFNKIDAFRRLEMVQLSIRKYLDAFCVFFWASTPVIVQTSVFVIVVYSGNDLTAANAFTAVSLLERLVYPMNYFPWIINGFLEARVSALRIRAFLFPADSVDDIFSAPKLLSSHRSGDVVSTTAEAQSATFAWTSRRHEKDADDEEQMSTPLVEKETPARSFNLHIEKLELRASTTYVVCGSIGSGKSSLLLALLGEMSLQSGTLRVRQRQAAYAPQTPWLFNGTVRDNITMSVSGDPIDEALYQRVLRVCELNADLLSRDAFDMARVSENGSNFSGGQKIRINLARALFQRAKLYLLDDPLSGLDVKTACAVVKNCYRENIFPVGATIVLATHALQFIEEFPDDVRVLVLADGKLIQDVEFRAIRNGTSESEQSTLNTFVAMYNAVSSNVDHFTQANHVNSNDDSTEEKTKNTPQSKTIDETEPSSDEEEHRESGTINFGVWMRYATAIGWPLALAILLAVTVMQVSRNGLDWWIAFYTNSHSMSPEHFANTLLWITLVNCVAVFFRAFLFAFGGLQAARAIYAALVVSIFGASLEFFDTTPVGRILNRLSGDTYAVDESLPFILNIFLKDLADVVGTLAIIFYGNKYVLLILIPLGLVYFRLQEKYRPISRHVQRLESSTQSPILSLFTETLDGLSVIRALNLESQYCKSYETCLNVNQRMSFLGANAGSWFGIRLDMLGVGVTSFVVVFAVVDFQLSGQVHPGVLGLTLTYALPVVSKLNTILGSFVDTERQMIATERVKEYADLPPEEQSPRSISSNLMIPPAWPASGEVSVECLSVAYNSTLAARRVQALTRVTCTFQAGEKVGICGRTGAGKSTFMHALFRAVEWGPGSAISIDGVAINQVPLQFLRARLTYVPQDVVLFAGTVRTNLDPEGKMADHELWACLARSGLDSAVSRLARGLDSKVESGEVTFSKGQAQLLCFARALLRRSKVLCIDEATSSIDYTTESIISKTLEQDFADSTVIIIAHRLKTITNCERIFLFDQGTVIESGPPQLLLADPQSKFSALASHEYSDARL